MVGGGHPRRKRHRRQRHLVRRHPQWALVPDYQLSRRRPTRSGGAIALSSGIHGLSNLLLVTPWPQMLRAKARLAAALSENADPVEGAFALLADRERAPPSSLPSTGVAEAWERLLSSAFIVHPDYGTRCSTVFTIDVDRVARFVERSFDKGGELQGEVVYRFEVARSR